MFGPGFAAGMEPGGYSIGMATVDILSLSPTLWFDSRFSISTSGGNVTSWVSRVGSFSMTPIGTVPYVADDAVLGHAPSITTTTTTGMLCSQLPATTTAFTAVCVCCQTSTPEGYSALLDVSDVSFRLAMYGRLAAANSFGIYMAGERPFGALLPNNVPSVCSVRGNDYNELVMRLNGVASTDSSALLWQPSTGRTALSGGDVGQGFPGRIASGLIWQRKIAPLEAMKLARAIKRLYGATY